MRNPGGQITNSFQPTEDEWFKDLYVFELDASRYKTGELRLHTS